MISTILLLTASFLLLRSGVAFFSGPLIGGRRFTQRSSNIHETAGSTASHEPLLRIGHGYDIHRLKEGADLIIGGVKIPHELGADAHSDGDAVYHSVVDAILGALTLPDIGQLFPGLTCSRCVVTYHSSFQCQISKAEIAFGIVNCS